MSSILSLKWIEKRHFAMRYPIPGPAGPAGPKGGSVSTKTFNETQCARRATSSINSPCLVSYFGSNQKKRCQIIILSTTYPLDTI